MKFWGYENKINTQTGETHHKTFEGYIDKYSRKHIKTKETGWVKII